MPVNSIIQNGALNLQLIGVNANVYSLPSTTLTFNILSADIRTPEITDIQLIEVTQTSAKVSFACSDIATAYYLLALKGTALPSLDEMKTLGPPQYETTQSTYGIFYVGQEQTGLLSFSGLTAETTYTIYILLQDRGFNLIQAPGSLEFTTKSSLLITFRKIQRSICYAPVQSKLLEFSRTCIDLSNGCIRTESQFLEGSRK
jgi:hypothetical protein